MLAHDKVLHAFRQAGFDPGDAPTGSSLPEPPAWTEIPPSADGEPIFEPVNGARPQRQDETRSEIQPFETFDASQWEGVPIEPRRWIAHDRIPVGEPGIMSGDGGHRQNQAGLAACRRHPGRFA
jgi:hypothetical protein